MSLVVDVGSTAPGREANWGAPEAVRPEVGSSGAPIDIGSRGLRKHDREQSGVLVEELDERGLVVQPTVTIDGDRDAGDKPSRSRGSRRASNGFTSSDRPSHA